MTDDAELFRAWRAGDRAAGEALFERHYDAIDRFFVNKVGDRAGDLVQRTFLAAVEAGDRFRGDSSFRTFLFAIARNLLLKEFRDGGRERARIDPGSVSVADLDPSPSAVAARHEEQRLVLTALRRLPLDEQIALELHYWEELSGAEIAAVLEIPVGTAKTRLRRARERLEQQLAALARPGGVLTSTLAGLDRWAAGLRAALDRRD